MKTVVNNNKNNIINKFKIQWRNHQKRGLARFYVAIIIIIVIINFIIHPYWPGLNLIKLLQVYLLFSESKTMATLVKVLLNRPQHGKIFYSEII